MPARSDGGGAAALDGVIEGYNRFLKKAEGRWPLFVIVTTDGGSAGSARDDELDSKERWAVDVGVSRPGTLISVSDRRQAK